jgi:hypothetical protein
MTKATREKLHKQCKLHVEIPIDLLFVGHVSEVYINNIKVVSISCEWGQVWIHQNYNFINRHSE